MSVLGITGSTLVFVASFALNFVVLAYRSGPLSGVRTVVDRVQRWVTGRPDWSWVRLWHILIPLVLITAANIFWNFSTAHCSDDSFAILASGQAALHGHNPFAVAFCGEGYTTEIPYGLAAVSLNALGAVSGTTLGIWVVWQLLALAVVPLVWGIAGPAQRYASVLAAASVLYLPNIATNLGVDNAVVAVSVLLMIYALGSPRRGSAVLRGLSAFLSTARFPALFPLLGSSASQGRRRGSQLVLVCGVFLGAAALSFWLWGWDAIQVVYLGQFARANSESLNLFALLIHAGWVQPSLTTAAVQGSGLLLLVLFVHLRRYSTLPSCAVPLLGVMVFSQYLNFHFLVWLVPLILMGTTVNWWLLAFAAVAALDENVLYWNLALVHGVWWPYELCGVLLFAILVCMLYMVVRDEEARLRSRVEEGGDSARESPRAANDRPSSAAPKPGETPEASPTGVQGDRVPDASARETAAGSSRERGPPHPDLSRDRTNPPRLGRNRASEPRWCS